ncbi:MAG: hypothetical protein OXE79_08865 [Acidimicrobiaceae bacterium]|nr:hypothetical protein [Acidimicrobiaceae bacterium]MCY4280805.1 hypothetical protein [Acidimicrobiaceae bacterium]MCY4295001.1 hypothetical protein [Acidimicrobiaceae bacterium]
MSTFGAAYGAVGLLWLGFLVTTVVMILTSDLNQTLSDRIVGTVVIKQDR